LINGANIGSTHVVVSCLDGLAATLAGKDIVKAARLFAASDNLRARAGLLRSSGEQGLYQPHVDALDQKLTSRERADLEQEVVTLGEAVIVAQTAVDRPLE
jgi:hypothetical protein